MAFWLDDRQILWEGQERMAFGVASAFPDELPVRTEMAVAPGFSGRVRPAADLRGSLSDMFSQAVIDTPDGLELASRRAEPAIT
jgi:hypothetical protein